MSVKDDAEAFAGAVSESNSGGETLLDVSGGEQDFAIPAASNVSANGFSESGSEHGILGEMGDYPVEEEMSDFDPEMDLESGSFLETFQVAYAQKAEDLPQIVSWQDGKGYQSDWDIYC